MTRNEILNMQAGAKIDALIAEKVMGWKEIPFYIPSWQPSANMSAAFQALEESSSWELEKKEHDNGDVYYECCCWSHKFQRWSEATADTPALAICHAVLLTTIKT